MAVSTPWVTIGQTWSVLRLERRGHPSDSNIQWTQAFTRWATSVNGTLTNRNRVSITEQ
jgi:hypothetical protein